MRLHVEIPALTLELTLAEVRSLLANLPRRAMKSPVALLRACYARLHGVDPATCSHAFSEPHQMAWKNFKRSVDAVLDGKSASAAAQRQQIVIVFDFDAGKFTKRIANAAAAASGEQPEQQVAAAAAAAAGPRALPLSTALATEGSDLPLPPPARARHAAPLAVRLLLRRYDEHEENLTLDELAAVAVARQSGRREASAKAPVRPRRECSTAAADACARDELEQEQALADALWAGGLAWSVKVNIREDREFVWDGSQLFAAHP